MSLLALPNELLLLVTSTLSTSDLPSLILANSRLCSLLTPTLTALARQDHRVLHHAVAGGYHDIMQHHLSLSIPASIADSGNFTALHAAVSRGDAVAARILLNHGAAPGAAAGHYRVTPLLKAVAGTSEEIVRVLLECGVDPNTALRGGSITPMFMLFERTHNTQRL